MTKDNKKQHFGNNSVRAAVFLCLIVLIVAVFNHYLGFAGADRTNTVLKQFYAQEDNTVDSVYFGSSLTQRGFVSPVAFHDHGIASYSIATGSQPFMLTRYMMEDVLRSQDPELFIIDLKNICRGKDKFEDSAVRKIIDNMQLSRVKHDAIQAVVNYAEGSDSDVDMTGMSYYFPLLKYHNRWNPDLQPEYWDDLYYFKGYTLAASVCFDVKKIDPPEFDADKKAPVAPENEAVLNDLLDYCDSIDQKVLFVVAPYQATEEGMAKLNYASDIIRSRGYEVLNFLDDDLRAEAGLDTDTCFHNEQHMNYYGSLKYTEYLSNYIINELNVTDRRGDASRESWEDAYGNLQKLISSDYADRYEDMIEKIEDAEAK